MKTMKTMKLWRLAFAMLAAFSVASCDKDDPFVDTDSGKNTLGFLLNGKKVEYVWYAPILPPAVSLPTSQGAHAIEHADTLEIYSKLTGAVEVLDGLEQISLCLPLNQVSQGAVLNNTADIVLPFLTGKEIDSDGWTHMFWGHLKVTSSRVSIRTCKRGELISGTFECEGDAEFPDGTSKHCKITNGHFDVDWEIWHTMDD